MSQVFITINPIRVSLFANALHGSGTTTYDLATMNLARNRLLAPEYSAFWLALVSIITIMASLFWVLHQQYMREIEHARLETVNLSNMLIDETRKTFDQVALLLQGAHERLDRHLQHRPIHTLSSDTLFPAQTGIAPFVSSIALTDLNGRVLRASHPGLPEQLTLDLGNAFRGRGNSLFISRPVFHIYDRQWRIKIIKEYRRPGQAFHGYIVATIMLGYFTEHFSKMQFDYPQPIHLYLNDGSVVAASNQLEANHPHQDHGGLPHTTLEKISELRAGQSVLIEKTGFFGFPTMVGLGRIEDYPFIIQVDGNAAEMLHAWKNTSAPVVIGSFFASIFITVIAALFYRKIQSEKALQAELLALSAKVHVAREMERANFARELHDQLGQLLTSIRFRLAWFEHRFAANDEYTGQLKTIKHQLDETIGSVRRMTAQLRPLILDDFGLYAALQWLISGIEEQSSLRITTELSSTEPPKGSDIASVIFRIVQESLNNIAKHADARQVMIELENSTDGHWRLTISDDGSGFDTSLKPEHGFGLIAMRERVESLGGTLKIKSVVGEGTRISAKIPVGQIHHETL